MNRTRGAQARSALLRWLGCTTVALASVACGDGGSSEASSSGADDGVGTTLGTDESGAETTGSTSASTSGLDESGDTTGNEDGEVGEEGCSETNVMAESVPPNVVLVLDYSSSMQNAIEFFGDSRWAVLWDAVEYLTSNFDDRLNFGAVLFPDMSVTTNNSCQTSEVEVPVAALNGATIMSTIPPRSDDPPGNTPTQAGLMVAAGHLQSLDPTVDRVLILVTDGEALCKPGASWEETTDDTVDEYVAGLAAQGIPTYVVGMANLGSTAQAQLDEVAIAGGVPQVGGAHSYYDAADLAGLQAAFDAIGGQVVSCEIQLEMAPPSENLLYVEIDGTAVPYVEDCSMGDGWTFVPDSAMGRIELCGAACVDFKESGEVRAVQLCPPPG